MGLKSYKIDLRLLVTVVVSIFSVTLAAAQSTVTGRITDGADGQPMAGVSILQPGRNTGVVSGADGRYTISVSGADSQLSFSYLGYEPQTIDVNNRTTIDVIMQPGVQTLDQVVVVGYGAQTKASLTGAVEQITAKDIENRSVPNAVGVLQGKMPGVTVIKKSSQPGNPDISITIRGEGTLGNNQPLVLIDGVPGDINTINPEDIESVSVLKDAATAAIYGVRASGGVVLFTTKKGRRNEPLKVTASAYYGLQTTTRNPEFVGTADYMRLRNEARTNVGESRIYTEADIQGVLDGSANPYLFANTDWVKEIYKSVAPIQNYNTSVSGGTGRSTYYASYGYLNHQGIAVGNRYSQDKHNIRANISSEIIKNWFTVEGGISYTTGINKTPASGTSPIYNALRMPVTAPIKNSEGNYMFSLGNMNPIAEIMEGGFSDYKFQDVVMTVTGRLDIMKGLSAKITYSAYRATGISKTFAAKYKYYDMDNNFTAYNRNDASMSQSTMQNGSDDLTIQGDFNRTFGKHNITAVAGFTQDNGQYETYGASIDRFATNSLYILSAGEYNPRVNGYANHFALRSWFFRVGENYDKKYYVEALIRQDMTSRFAKHNRVGTFYAFSGSWRITEEKFMENVRNGKYLNELKIRGSYGSVGNQNVSGSLYPTFVEMNKLSNIWPLGNQETSGYAQLILPNPDIKWETSYMTNIGMDAEFFRHRLKVSADVFWRKTTDIISQPTLPSVLGLGQASINLGEVKSRGWEISVGWSDRKGEWSYSIDGYLADSKNKVVSLGGEPSYADALIKPGYEMRALYGYRVERIAQESDFTYDPTTGKRVPNFAYPEGWWEAGLVNPGDLIYKDLDDSGTIDSDDREVIGSMQPRYTFGINASVGWKNFDLSIFVQGVGKVNGYVYSEAMHPFMTDYAQPQKFHLSDRWTPDNTNARYPRLTEKMDYNSGLFSDYWLQDASYMRVKNIALGYTLPKKLTSRIGLDKCRVYIAAENPFTFTNYFYAFDPETILNNGSFYPQTRIFYIGLNLNF